MMEHITEPWQVVFLGVAGLVFAVGLVIWIRTGIAPDAEPVDFDPLTLIDDAWSALLHWRPLPMSSRNRAEKESVSNPVCIPVSGMPYHPHGMDIDAPDIDAENTDMPRVSRNITDGEMIVLLAAQKGANGKHRYSANKIYELVGGDRNTVLARVRELRSVAPPAEFRQPDGSTAPATRPVTGRRTAA